MIYVALCSLLLDTLRLRPLSLSLFLGQNVDEVFNDRFVGHRKETSHVCLHFVMLLLDQFVTFYRADSAIPFFLVSYQLGELFDFLLRSEF